MKNKHWLAGILLLGFLIRLAAVKTGLPSETLRLATYHPDESITFYSLEAMNPAELDFYPGDSLYWGTFLVYSEGALAGLMELAGFLDLGGREGLKNNLGEVDKLYISGRLIAMIFGAACAYVMFLIGSLFFSRPWALASSFLMAVVWVHLYSSIFVKPDSIMLFWGLWTVYFALLLVRTGKARYYILSGIFAGLSVVSKYNGVLFCLFPLLAHIYIACRRKNAGHNLKFIFLAGLASFLVFVILNPYFVLRNSDAMRYMLGMASKSSWSENIIKGYFDYFAYTLSVSFGLPLLVFALGGLAGFLKKFTPERLIVFVFALIHILYLAPAEKQAINYCLILAPFFIIFAVDLSERLWTRKWGKILAAFVFAYTFAHSLYLLDYYARNTTLKKASDWIGHNIPAGSKIVISKNDAWVPPVVRAYDSPYRVIEGKSPKATLSDAVKSLGRIYKRGDYVLLAETEYYEFLAEPGRYSEEARTVGEVLSASSEIKVFDKELSRFFVPFQNRHILDLKWSSPKIHVLKPL